MTLPNDVAWVDVRFEVPGPHEGLRVDAFLVRRLHRYSRTEVQKLIAQGRVVRQGIRVKASVRVVRGDVVIVRYPRREEPPAAHSTLQIIYEDADILAINKPGDVLSHPTDKVTVNTVISILRRQRPGVSLHLVHRLDRETSGVLILAKNPEAARALVDQFTMRRVRKQYLAIVAGRVEFTRTSVDWAIAREDCEIKVRQKAITRPDSALPAAQAAVTQFERLDFGADYSLIRAVPKTGRLHQIRVHLAALGHPVVGDKLYTGKGAAYLKAVRRQLTAQDTEALGASRQMLHAGRLDCRHPTSGEPLVLTAPPPRDFMDCLARLKLSLPLASVAPGSNP